MGHVIEKGWVGALFSEKGWVGIVQFSCCSPREKMIDKQKNDVMKQMYPLNRTTYNFL